MAKKSKKQKKDTGSLIAVNKKARHDFEIGETWEAGLALQGWEVKSLRDKRVNLNDTYVMIQHGEAWLVGAHITPLASASTHVRPEPTRARKLLLHRYELNKLIGQVERKGFTLVPLRLYWKKDRAKLEIGLGKGKKLHDKRADIKERDWAREKARRFKHA
ncbi:SsrA-binding protein SmpB [endosymbiont of unidentified scaly snail isolate Monju]|uniref:SsrA-binding protein SmpB n=1 Tax=endosymbiont of unidentified scaly snail isolate Monju TaxID=1248727 RepID=UPI0003892498|nr:SsrA-binding protein SmpB [endosymbiont of unidentified scaly snail isolate Monju]BAN68988.1 SsrA-binding protein [endosymbiont of unidentified scaly snail isolate Monju]